MTKKRLVSGIQPTGKMHLGNYLGAIQSWVTLQNEYDAYFIIVDLHSLTTIYENTQRLKTDKWELALDILASGVDPKKSSLFYQSDVPEHSELHLILSMITPLSWVMRVPTYKGKIEEVSDKNLDTYGFLGYPVLQAADIMLYKSNIVPVGKDQLPHLELTREIVRRFNHLVKADVFPEPEDKCTQFPILMGTDGRKMSKSYHNTLPISDTEEEMKKKIMKMLTDSNRVRRNDPGNPDQCPVFSLHNSYTKKEDRNKLYEACQKALIGCVDCKSQLFENINNDLAEFREKRRKLELDKDYVQDVLVTGAKKARCIAKDTLREVKESLGIL